MTRFPRFRYCPHKLTVDASRTRCKPGRVNPGLIDRRQGRRNPQRLESGLGASNGRTPETVSGNQHSEVNMKPGKPRRQLLAVLIGLALSGMTGNAWAEEADQAVSSGTAPATEAAAEPATEAAAEPATEAAAEPAAEQPASRSISRWSNRMDRMRELRKERLQARQEAMERYRSARRWWNNPDAEARRQWNRARSDWHQQLAEQRHDYYERLRPDYDYEYSYGPGYRHYRGYGPGWRHGY